MIDWQPIATAPKPALKPPVIDLWVEGPDGTGERVPDCIYQNNIWKHQAMRGFWVRAFRETHTATHWMRRPGPPAASETSEALLKSGEDRFEFQGPDQ